MVDRSNANRRTAADCLTRSPHLDRNRAPPNAGVTPSTTASLSRRSGVSELGPPAQCPLVMHFIPATPARPVASPYVARGKQPREPDEEIERIRRAHHNDLESILPFLAVGFLAAATGAVSYRFAWWLFVPFTTARILHTIAYSLGLQPWRSIFFGIADLALWITAISLLVASV